MEPTTHTHTRAHTYVAGVQHIAAECSNRHHQRVRNLKNIILVDFKIKTQGRQGRPSRSSIGRARCPSSAAQVARSSGRTATDAISKYRLLQERRRNARGGVVAANAVGSQRCPAAMVARANMEEGMLVHCGLPAAAGRLVATGPLCFGDSTITKLNFISKLGPREDHDILLRGNHEPFPEGRPVVHLDATTAPVRVAAPGEGRLRCRCSTRS